MQRVTLRQNGNAPYDAGASFIVAQFSPAILSGLPRSTLTRVAPTARPTPILPIVNPTFDLNVPLSDLIIRESHRRGFYTKPHCLVLWSGLGSGRKGVIRSKAYAMEHGGTTLEMTPGGAFLDELDLFGKSSPVNVGEAVRIWSNAASTVVEQASGQVRAVLGDVKPTSVYRKTELPVLRGNEKIIGLDEIYLSPKYGIK